MLRNLILLLVLVNVLLLIWSFWIQPPAVDNPAALADSSEPQLVLVVDESRPDLTVSEDAPGDALSCYRLGPFADSGPANEIAGTFSEQGFQATRRREASQIWLGHWVQLRDLASWGAARSALPRLAEGGLKDAYVLAQEPEPAVSLGLFRNKASADKVVRQAARLGFTAKVIDRYREGEEYWVRIESADGRVPATEDIQLDQGQIIRMELLTCDDDSKNLPDTDGDASPD